MDLDKSLEAFQNFLESAGGDEYFKELKRERETKDRRIEIMKRHIDARGFKEVMDIVLARNGDEWTDRCYKRGYAPHPSPIAYIFQGLVTKYGSQEPDVVLDDNMFETAIYKYDNYYFQIYCGQGECPWRIWTADKQHYGNLP